MISTASQLGALATSIRITGSEQHRERRRTASKAWSGSERRAHQISSIDVELEPRRRGRGPIFWTKERLAVLRGGIEERGSVKACLPLFPDVAPSSVRAAARRHKMPDASRDVTLWDAANLEKLRAAYKRGGPNEACRVFSDRSGTSIRRAASTHGIARKRPTKAKPQSLTSAKEGPPKPSLAAIHSHAAAPAIANRHNVERVRRAFVHRIHAIAVDLRLSQSTIHSALEEVFRVPRSSLMAVSRDTVTRVTNELEAHVLGMAKSLDLPPPVVYNAIVTVTKNRFREDLRSRISGAAAEDAYAPDVSLDGLPNQFPRDAKTALYLRRRSGRSH